MPDKFPLTLAEVLFEELYADPKQQQPGSGGEKLNTAIRVARKSNNEKIEFIDGWFDASENDDWLKRKKASEEIVRTRPHGEKTYKLDSPRESVRPIVEEALGLTDDKKPYVYLSDGGHFENLGLYEMILRRCRFIVVCDASTDTEYEYEALAMAIRQIRVDFGVPIDMSEMKFGRTPNAENNYCARWV